MKRKASSTTDGGRKRRRSYARRAMSSYRSSLTKLPEMRFLRKWKSSTWIWNTTTPSGFWRVFNPQLGDMPATERNELTGMFDEYKINRVTYEFVPRYINFDAGNSTLNPTPIFHYYSDVGNPLAPGGAYDQASLNNFAARANNGFKTVMGNKVFKVSYKPTVQTTDGEVKAFPWTSTSNITVSANALAVYVLAVNFANLLNTSEFDIMVTLDISVRALR